MYLMNQFSKLFWNNLCSYQGIYIYKCFCIAEPFDSLKKFYEMKTYIPEKVDLTHLTPLSNRVQCFFSNNILLMHEKKSVDYRKVMF